MTIQYLAFKEMFLCLLEEEKETLLECGQEC